MTAPVQRFAVLAIALCGCQAAPAHADAPRLLVGMPTGGGSPERLAPGDPLGYRPAPVPGIPGGSSGGRLFDLPVSGKGTIAAPPLLAAWRGAPDGWSPRGLDGPGGWYRGGQGGGRCARPPSSGGWRRWWPAAPSRPEGRSGGAGASRRGGGGRRVGMGQEDPPPDHLIGGQVPRPQSTNRSRGSSARSHPTKVFRSSIERKPMHPAVPGLLPWLAS